MLKILPKNNKTRGYTCVSAIQTAFSILQSGVIDRENKSELKKLREVVERMEGKPSGVIDILSKIITLYLRSIFQCKLTHRDGA